MNPPALSVNALNPGPSRDAVPADQASQLRRLVAAAAPAPPVVVTPPASPPSPAPVRPAAAAGPALRAPARTLAIASGKGGVGKTSVSVNLAVQLARRGRRVVLLDADLGTANADVICNVRAPRTLAHLIDGRCSIEELVIPVPGGFHLVPGASGLAHMADLDGPRLSRLTHGLSRLEDAADIILIDTGAGVGPGVLGFCAAAEDVLVVTTPEPTAVTDAYALIKTLHAQGSSHHLNLLVNMVRGADEARSVYERIAGVSERFLRVRPQFAGGVCRDEAVSQAVLRREPFALTGPRGRAASDVMQLAERFDRTRTEDAASVGDGGWWRRLGRWFGS